jgi:hypothetical protein
MEACEKLKSCTLHDKHTSLQYKLRQAIFVTTNQMFRCSIYRQKYRVPFKSRLGAKLIACRSLYCSDVCLSWSVHDLSFFKYRSILKNLSEHLKQNVSYMTILNTCFHYILNSLHIYPTPFQYNILNSLHIYPTPFTEQSTHLSHTLHWTVYTSELGIDV